MTAPQLSPEQIKSLLAEPTPPLDRKHDLPYTDTGLETHDWGDNNTVTACGRSVTGHIRWTRPSCKRCLEIGGWPA